MVDRTTPLTSGERSWLDRLIMPLAIGATILDLGCGGGEPIDRYLIDHGLNVVGVDIRAPLIELARTRFPRQRWLLGDMRAIALDESYDAVIVWNALHLLSRADQGVMAERAVAWLRPEGRLLFNAMPVPTDQRDGFRPGSRYADDLSADDYGMALTRRGLVEIAHIDNDTSCDGAGVWLIRKPRKDSISANTF